jgi:hypothetical protein
LLPFRVIKRQRQAAFPGFVTTNEGRKHNDNYQDQRDVLQSLCYGREFGFRGQQFVAFEEDLGTAQFIN